MAATRNAILHFSRGFSPSKTNRKTDICVLRRGGDMEKRILHSAGNWAALDEKHMLPILAELKALKKRIVLVTETQFPELLKTKYNPDIFSNKESLNIVFQRLSNCHCLFLAASSFGALIANTMDPRYIVHTVNSSDFQFNSYFAFREFGTAISVRSDPRKIIKLCSSD